MSEVLHGVPEDPHPEFEVGRVLVGFSMITDVNFLFNPDLMAELQGELPEWMNLSPLIPDCLPEEWPDTAPDADASDNA